MNKYYLFSIVFLLLQCRVIKNNEIKSIRSFTITGSAKDSKSGAVVVTTDSSVYYIDGVDFWKKKYLGKMVTVTGELIEIKNLAPIDSIAVSQFVEFKKIIKHSDVKLVR